MQETLRETGKILDELAEARKILEELKILTQQIDEKLDNAAKQAKGECDDD